MPASESGAEGAALGRWQAAPYGEAVGGCTQPAPQARPPRGFDAERLAEAIRRWRMPASESGAE